MKTYDLTRRMEADIPLYPGTPAPRFAEAATVEKNGYHETELSFFSHVGTHMDAPSHLLAGGQTLDAVAAERFLGRALVLDVSGAGGEISRSLLLTAEAELRTAEFLLLYTGWERHWNSERYLQGFPVLTREAAEYLAALPQLKGIGMDTLSPDPVGDTVLTNHRTLLGAGKLLIENLAGLAPLAGKMLRLAALPLHYARADGAPARVVAWEEEP